MTPLEHTRAADGIVIRIDDQKFHRGDVVRIDKQMPPWMRHFRADTEAIVMYSYRDLYGGNNTESYGVMFCDDGSECAWYKESQLTLIRHGGEEAIEAVTKARDERRAVESDLTWIVSNWHKIRKSPSCASLEKLMWLIGIANPWGSRGEGIVYDANVSFTLALLDPVLSTGDLTAVEAFRRKVKNSRPDGGLRLGE